LLPERGLQNLLTMNRSWLFLTSIRPSTNANSNRCNITSPEAAKAGLRIEKLPAQ
jgi:hypothetical protein